MVARHIRIASAADAGPVSALHLACFADGWSAAACRALLEPATALGLIAQEDGRIAAVLIGRIANDEAEIVTLAVGQEWRGRGLALNLIDRFHVDAGDRGAARVFLEVAADNAAALALYARAGYLSVGRRRGYYVRGGAAAVDAVLMARDL